MFHLEQGGGADRRDRVAETIAFLAPFGTASPRSSDAGPASTTCAVSAPRTLPARSSWAPTGRRWRGWPACCEGVNVHSFEADLEGLLAVARAAAEEAGRAEFTASVEAPSSRPGSIPTGRPDVESPRPARRGRAGLEGRARPGRDRRGRAPAAVGTLRALSAFPQDLGGWRRTIDDVRPDRRITIGAPMDAPSPSAPPRLLRPRRRPPWPAAPAHPAWRGRRIAAAASVPAPSPSPAGSSSPTAVCPRPATARRPRPSPRRARPRRPPRPPRLPVHVSSTGSSSSSASLQAAAPSGQSSTSSHGS